MSVRNKVTNVQKGKRGEITKITLGAASKVKTNHRALHAELESAATMIEFIIRSEQCVGCVSSLKI